MFGFSPGDIALFIKFALRVIAALRDEGGSKFEYQQAERHCQAFLEVMNEIKQLDLSRLPENFRDRITEYSTKVEELVGDFKKTISRFENSMGQNSQRRFYSSAPRKLQWAFKAAGDLQSFRFALSTQIELVKLAIQSSILWTRPSRMTPYPDSINGFGWRGLYAYNSAAIPQTVQMITDMVYERLLTLSNSNTTAGFTHTTQRIGRPVFHNRRLAFVRDEDEEMEPDEAHEISSDQQGGLGTSGDVIDEINEYLQKLNLDILSEEESRLFEKPQDGGGVFSGMQFLLPSSQRENASRDAGHEHPGDGSNFQVIRVKKRTGNQRNHFRPEPPLNSYFDIFSDLTQSNLVAGGMFGAAVGTMKLLNTANQIAHEAEGLGELLMVTKRFLQYSNLLQLVASVVRKSAPKGPLQELGWQVVEDTTNLLSRLEVILDWTSSGLRGKAKSSRTVIRYVASIRWHLRRNDIKQIMLDLEPLKSTLSLLLQLCHTEAIQRGLGVPELNIARIS